MLYIYIYVLVGSSKESGQINDDDCDSQDLMVLCDTDESDNNTRPAAITREEKKRGEKDKKGTCTCNSLLIFIVLSILT